MVDEYILELCWAALCLVLGTENFVKRVNLNKLSCSYYNFLKKDRRSVLEKGGIWEHTERTFTHE